jgi:hypothetical protein
MKLHVGTFKGKTLEEIPSSYVKFIAENWHERTQYDKELCKAADKEWKFREKNNTHFEEEVAEKPADDKQFADVLSDEEVRKLADIAINWCGKKGEKRTAYNICRALNELGRLIT